MQLASNVGLFIVGNSVRMGHPWLMIFILKFTAREPEYDTLIRVAYSCLCMTVVVKFIIDSFRLQRNEEQE